jgi:hypothetical protein
MIGGQKVLLVIICAGMGLSWIHAWTAFVMVAMGFQSFSVLDGAAILALSMGITWLHQGRAWRMVTILCIQAVGMALAACGALYRLFDWADPFWSGKWLALFWSREHTIAEWGALAVGLLWVAVLWTAGSRLVLKRPDPAAVSARFDLGAAAFLVLLLIHLIMIGKGVPFHPEATGRWGFLAFLMLGLLALGMGDDGAGIEKDAITPYGRLGAVLSFSILVLVCGGGLTMLFLPSLMSAAETANDLLRQASRPLVPVVVTGLRFIFLGGCRRAQEGCVPADQGDGVPDLPVGGSNEWGLLNTIITWGLAGFAGIIGLAMVIFGAVWLLRWLASRRPAEQKEASLWQVLVRMMRVLTSLFLSLLHGRMRRKKGRREGLYLYVRLQRWGGHCGLPRAPSETPMEYGSRLVDQFPVFKNEIPSVVAVYHETAYGADLPGEQEVVSARESLNRMRRPRHWPARIRSWVVSGTRTYDAT